MSEESRKALEINEEELEAVSGGGRALGLEICTKCGGNMLDINDTVDGIRKTFYKCVKCGYEKPI